ncbi:DUF6036 family nucleotidyltransferase [Frankia sp. Cppng1_Ct_nod]|uniref:DUF6036 family nucleotidyltransferase n=1 Tax=Frankia sp. Cppng1_Ct_nod TaxID=2897162 RepID=UPI0010410F55|nr:DUF6036 family nucleotidyltransferase [Frankia sp. Cppng1_Ct_nod]
MKREQLEHVLRAASTIAQDPEILVIGSQSVLAAISEDRLPVEATASMEVDIAFFDDVDDAKADLVDGAIGELSPFHETFGYYAQGVSVSTAVLPKGWRDRVIVIETASTAPGRGYCLDPHDCVVSKLIAGRPKDFAFADALVQERLVDPAILFDRVETTDAHPAVVQRIRAWAAGHMNQKPTE